MTEVVQSTCRRRRRIAAGAAVISLGAWIVTGAGMASAETGTDSNVDSTSSSSTTSKRAVHDAIQKLLDVNTESFKSPRDTAKTAPGTADPNLLKKWAQLAGQIESNLK
jgi:hypothetical protein